jgi:Cysteine-rich CWC
MRQGQNDERDARLCFPFTVHRSTVDESRLGMIDEQYCPLCKGENGCAMAAGQSVSACWCYGARVPRSVLDQVPPERRGAVCVCARCAAEGMESMPD